MWVEIMPERIRTDKRKYDANLLLAPYPDIILNKSIDIVAVDFDRGIDNFRGLVLGMWELVKHI